MGRSLGDARQRRLFGRRRQIDVRRSRPSARRRPQAPQGARRPRERSSRTPASATRPCGSISARSTSRRNGGRRARRPTVCAPQSPANRYEGAVIAMLGGLVAAAIVGLLAFTAIASRVIEARFPPVGEMRRDRRRPRRSPRRAPAARRRAQRRAAGARRVGQFCRHGPSAGRTPGQTRVSRVSPSIAQATAGATGCAATTPPRPPVRPQRCVRR